VQHVIFLQYAELEKDVMAKAIGRGFGISLASILALLILHYLSPSNRIVFARQDYQRDMS